MPDPAIPQASFSRRPGVCYARTAQHLEIPVIDVSNPAFTVADDAQSVEALRQASVGMTRRNARMPRFLLRLLIRAAAKRSSLAQAMLRNTDKTFLPGMDTYLIKLGADNLVPPFDTPADRRFAAYPGILGVRIRLQQTARLLAEGLEPTLSARPGAPLHLLNIGGGSAIDSLNALILGASVVAGSVTRADELTRAGLQFTHFKLMPRGAHAFADLIRGSGFRIERVYDSLASDQVLLVPEPRA